jgi:hypothetical protein
LISAKRLASAPDRSKLSLSVALLQERGMRVHGAGLGSWLRILPAVLIALVAAALLVSPAGAVKQRLAQAGSGTALAVDVELVLAVDISLSMDPDEQRLQRDGYIAALRDPEIIKAIRAGQHGRIAITYMEWAGPDIQIHLVPWRVIDGRESAEAFVAELAAKPYSRYRRTSISAALEYSMQLFDDKRFRAGRRVIDVSGDGANNSGPPLMPVRDRIVEEGVVINGLPIILRPTMVYSSWDLPNLDRYYASCVIGGPGSFMVPITKPEEFATATRQKLLMEISGIEPAPRVMQAQFSPPAHAAPQGPPSGEGAYDCALLERGIRRW